jgi:hypothetical protein
MAKVLEYAQIIVSRSVVERSTPSAMRRSDVFRVAAALVAAGGYLDAGQILAGHTGPGYTSAR